MLDRCVVVVPQVIRAKPQSGNPDQTIHGLYIEFAVGSARKKLGVLCELGMCRRVAVHVIAQVLVDGSGLWIVSVHVVARPRHAKLGAVGYVLPGDEVDMLESTTLCFFETVPGSTGDPHAPANGLATVPAAHSFWLFPSSSG